MPRYLDERDHPWLRALLDEYARFDGQPRRELDERLREPLPVPCSEEKMAQARWVLDRACRDRTRAAIRPREARATLFSEAARGAPREKAIARAAHALDTNADTLLECLFADLPGERRLCPPPQELSPSMLALQANLAHAQALLARATRVEIRALGGARDLVRHAQLRGLLGTVRRAEDGRRYVLGLSGPLLLFRRTLVYGRALASLVPRLAWCDHFRPQNRWLLEIMGFWTPEYVTRKLARLRAAGLERLVLCIDEERDCGSEELPPGSCVVRYRRRIDAHEIRSIVEGHPWGFGVEGHRWGTGTR